MKPLCLVFSHTFNNIIVYFHHKERHIETYLGPRPRENTPKNEKDKNTSNQMLVKNIIDQFTKDEKVSGTSNSFNPIHSIQMHFPFI